MSMASPTQRVGLGSLCALGACILAFAFFVASRRGWFHRAASKQLVQRTTLSLILPELGATNGNAKVRVTQETVNVAGTKRHFELVVPRTHDQTLPVVFVLHGDGGDGPGFHAASPFEHASGEGAIVVYPSGTSATWDLDTASNNRDHAFLEAIVDYLNVTYTIDRKRVFGTGYSSGAFLVNFMACERPGFFRAIASNAGSAPYGRSQTYPNGYTKCENEKPVPMLALHGGLDYTVTLQSGLFSADYWAYVNGCALGTWETTGYLECKAYQGCLAGNDVAYCEIADLGHWVWSRHAEATWSFFREHGAFLPP
jgi:polyhydroxybutyrate depolymerase